MLMFLTPAVTRHFVSAAPCAVLAPLWIERRDERRPLEGCTDRRLRLWRFRESRNITLRRNTNEIINNDSRSFLRL